MGACNSSYRGGVETYNRPRLTYPPAFENLIVGNMNDVKDKIEETLLGLCESSLGEVRIKDKLRFQCIINPPRHGKSLLLDILFQGNQSVLVIPISYNGDTNFSSIEIASPRVAIAYFWLRVLKTLLSLQTALKDLYDSYKHVNWSFTQVRKICRKKLLVDPFLNDGGRRKNVLICVDEFSLLTDSMNADESWRDADKQQFVSALQNEMTAKPFLQYVLTGFNTNLSTLLGYSAAKVDCYVLKMCSYAQSRPLLRLIANEYAKQNPPVDVPASLFEAIKCTPGLVGLWAECVVREKRCDRSLVEFQTKAAPNWLKTIVNSNNITRNWHIILEYLLHLERDYSTVDAQQIAENRISSALIEYQIGIGRSDVSAPQIIPLCFVLIIRSMFEHMKSFPTDIIEADKALIELYSQALDACDKTTFKDNRGGENFENFVYAALVGRLQLHAKLSQECPGSAPCSRIVSIGSEEMVAQPQSLNTTNCYSIQVGKFFPGPIYKCTSKLGSFFLHPIRSKPDLNSFLLPPLYYLFPRTIKSLKMDTEDTDRSSLQDWLKSDGFLKTYNPLLQKNVTSRMLFHNRNAMEYTAMPPTFDFVLPMKREKDLSLESGDELLELMKQIKEMTRGKLSWEEIIPVLADKQSEYQKSNDAKIKRQSGILLKLKEGLHFFVEDLS